MSAQRIKEILNDHTIIDYNLMSDSLSNILIELCSIITNQEKEFEFIKSEMAKFAIKSEIEEQLKRSNNSSNIATNDLSNVMGSVNAKFDQISNLIDSNNKTIENKFQNMEKQINEKTDQKISELQGEYFITSQQIKDLTNYFKNQKILIEDNTNNINKINEILKQDPDQTVDIVAGKVNDLAQKVEEIKNEIKINNLASTSQIEENQQTFQQFQDSTKTEIAQLGNSIKELKKIIVEAPSIEFDGAVDTEALMRAIQRNSRRLDSFNQTISSLRDDNQEVRNLFIELANCFQKLQFNLLDFVKEHNKTKKDIIAVFDENSQKIKHLKATVSLSSNNMKKVIEASLKGINQISTSFSQIVSFLGTITSRSLPLLGDFDDNVLEYQHLLDSLTDYNEKMEEANKKESQKECMTVSDNVFKVPIVTIPDLKTILSRTAPPPAATTSQANQSVKSENNAPANLPRTAGLAAPQSAVIDIGLMQEVREMKDRLDESLSTMTNLSETIDGKIENKVDNAQMERVVDKLRTMVNKLRDQMTSQTKLLSTYVQKKEIEQIVQNSIATASIDGDTAACTNHVECLLCGKRKAPLNTDFPMLTSVQSSPAKTHEVMYGKSFESPVNQSMTFDMRNYQTPQGKRLFTAQSDRLKMKIPKTPQYKKV